MNLGELITHLRDNILHDRSHQIAGAVSSYLWSDATLALYINEAQRRLCRKAAVLRDGTNPEVTQFTTNEGTEFYPLHPSILSVMSVRFDADTVDLPRAGHSNLDTYQRSPSDPYFFDASTIAMLPPGKPRCFTTDEYLTLADDSTLSVINMRLWPTPDADSSSKVVRMRVTRLPLNTLVATNLEAVPEVPEEYHLQMLDWAAYLALRIVDIDGGQAQRAVEFRDSFNAYVEEINIETKGKLLQPVTIGFGRSGFAYERD